MDGIEQTLWIAGGAAVVITLFFRFVHPGAASSRLDDSWWLVVARPALLLGMFYLLIFMLEHLRPPSSTPQFLLLFILDVVVGIFVCASYGWCVAFQFGIGDAHPMLGPIVGVASVGISAAVGLASIDRAHVGPAVAALETLTAFATTVVLAVIEFRLLRKRGTRLWD